MKSLAAADRHGWPRYVANQVYYSLIGRGYEWDLMPLGQDQGLGALVWSPLGWGRLTGKIRRDTPLLEGSRPHDTASFGPPVDDENLYRVVDALDTVAAETGKTVPQAALNWLVHRPTVSSVIVGARNEEQLRQKLGAVGWTLSTEQIAMLDGASAGDRALSVPSYHRQEGFARLNRPKAARRNVRQRHHVQLGQAKLSARSTRGGDQRDQPAPGSAPPSHSTTKCPTDTLRSIHGSCPPRLTRRRVSSMPPHHGANLAIKRHYADGGGVPDQEFWH